MNIFYKFNKKISALLLTLITGIVIMLMVYFYVFARDHVSVEKYPCLSYIPSNSWRESFGMDVNDTHIKSDLLLLRKYTTCIRVYQSRGIYERIPIIAHNLNMTVRQGVWFDGNKDNNRLEIDALKRILASVPPKTFESVVVGNEVLLFGRLSVTDYISYLKEVKSITTLPIVWADTYNIFLDEDYIRKILPLVDIVGVHVFPYWMGVSIDEAVSSSIQGFEIVTQYINNKKVEIYEIGWPSDGYINVNAKPSASNQGKYLQSMSDFLKILGVSSFNIIEAFDQPSKMFMHNNEGWTGGHWGILDVWGMPKSSAHIIYIYWIMCIGIIFFLWSRFLWFVVDLVFDPKYIYFLISIVVTVGIWGVGMYGLISGYLIFRFTGIILLILQCITALIIIRIYYQIYFSSVTKENSNKEKNNLLNTRLVSKGISVSIHIPCSGESPDNLKQTINSCLEQTYPVFEILVGINNCDISRYEEIINFFKKYPQVRIYNLGVCLGAKGEALNKLLKLSDPKIEYIAYLDADYVVKDTWILDSVSIIENGNFDIVLFPQKYNIKSSHERQDWFIPIAAQLEFDLCFDIDSFYRDADNAVLLHGTLCLINRKRLIQVSGWPEDNICEDSELGIKILDIGGKIKFVNLNVGEGLPPASFGDYFRQHRRWAHGGMVTLRRMLFRCLFKKDSLLNISQIRQYFMSWIPWILQVFLPSFFIAGFFGTLYLNYDPRLIPPLGVVMFPILMFISNICFTSYLLKRKYKLSIKEIFFSLIVFAAITPSICDGVLSGLLGLKRPFEVTSKKEKKYLSKIDTKKVKKTFKYKITSILSTFLYKTKITMLFIKDEMTFHSLLVISITIFQVIYLIIFNRIGWISIIIWSTFLLLVALPSFAEFILIVVKSRYCYLVEKSNTKCDL